MTSQTCAALCIALGALALNGAVAQEQSVLRRLPPIEAPSLVARDQAPHRAAVLQPQPGAATGDAADRLTDGVAPIHEASVLSEVPEPNTVSANTRLGLTFGYDGGFIISSPSGTSLDTDAADFLMRVGGWGQLRHSYFSSDGPNPDLNDLEWERLRFVVDGHAYSSDFMYFFQMDADSDDSEMVDMLDYYVTYDFGHDLFGADRKRIALRLGKWKIPFARSREESGTRLAFTDRTIAGVFFDFNRSIGVGLTGEADCFNWDVTLTNGINTGGFQTGRSGDLDRNFAVATRITKVLSGDYGGDGESDIDFRTVPAWRVGTGFTYGRVDRDDGPREFARQRAVDSGEPLSMLLPPGVEAYNIYMFAADSHVKYRGFSLITEYLFRQISGFAGAPVTDLFDHGLIVQSGYFIVPHKLELLARWSRIIGDSGTLGARDESADEIGAGVVWFIRGQNMKITFDATHLNGAPISDSALNILPGDDGWLYRTQFQFKF